MKERTVRTVVIGSGCAGLNAADWLYDLGERDFVLVTEGMRCGTSRNTGSDKQTYYKLSLSGDDGDSVGDMARTLKRADVDGDIALCEAAASAQSFFKLVSLGVPFPHNEFGEYVGYQTDHDTRKRATSAGPLTSRFMTEALEGAIIQKGVEVLDRTLAVKVLTDEGGVRGLLCFQRDAREWLLIRCANVVQCTGGPADIYQNSVYPQSQFGASSLAFEAGAAGANLDCWQYGLASVKFRWNVSGSYQQAIPRYISVDDEGVQREFLSDALGKEALDSVFLKGYQWPFDPRKADGSSRVDMLVKREEDMGRRVYMDYTKDPQGFSLETLGEEARQYLLNCGATMATPIERLRAINAPAIELYRAHGIDLATEPLEVRVCAQHQNGGIAVDANWQTDVQGLYVCGEAAGTFGQYRPGGTALNSTQAGSMRAARHIAHNGRKPSEESISITLPALPAGDPVATAQRFRADMTRYAAFQRDAQGMQRILQEAQATLQSTVPADASDPQIEARIRLRALLLTQCEVLSAMLYALDDPSEGVLITRNGASHRRAARPLPERDEWFESVWKRFREERV